MVINTVENIVQENSTGEESTSGQMDPATKDNSTRECVTDRVVGAQLVPIPTFTSVPTKKTRKQVMDGMSGPMAACTKVDSPTTSSTHHSIQTRKGKIDLPGRKRNQRNLVIRQLSGD